MTSVAIQGIRGSYSDAAALELFGSGAELIECRTFGDVFDALTDGVAEYAVLPVRNSIIGEIGTVAGLLLTHTTERSDEIDIQIEHVLAAAELIRCEQSQDSAFALGGSRSVFEIFRGEPASDAGRKPGYGYEHTGDR